MTGGNPFLAGELHMFQQGLTPEHIREDARSEAYEEHPCPPARDEEKEGYHTACPSLGARRFWCSAMVNEHTVSHRAVSFSTPGCEYHWTSCRKSSITVPLLLTRDIHSLQGEVADEPQPHPPLGGRIIHP